MNRCTDENTLFRCKKWGYIYDVKTSLHSRIRPTIHEEGSKMTEDHWYRSGICR